MVRTASAAERWRVLLRRQAESGLSVAEFCRRQNVSQASFYQWRKRLRRKSPAEGGAFLPVSLVGATGVEVELPCGAVVRVALGDQRALEHLITLLMRQEGEPA